jgi:hypothetical protein
MLKRRGKLLNLLHIRVQRERRRWNDGLLKRLLELLLMMLMLLLVLLVMMIAVRRVRVESRRGREQRTIAANVKGKLIGERKRRRAVE